VLCQGYPNLQYIVVDGASTDGSLDIIDRYRDRIAVVISEPDRGHGDALNKGFARADGQILAWLNSDDMKNPYLSCPWNTSLTEWYRR
jgi:glycosyltransferase involved in cell wall biosynthesis